MLIKLLSQQDVNQLLLFAELLSFSDKTLLWNKKPIEKITSSNGSEKVSIRIGKPEAMLLADWRKNAKNAPEEDLMVQVLLQSMNDIPLREYMTNLDGIRWNSVYSALHGILRKQPPTNPHAIRIMLYELMLMALADGKISNIEYRFLEEFKHHHKVDDYAFDEIRERAENMYRETQKTIALVLE